VVGGGWWVVGKNSNARQAAFVSSSQSSILGPQS